MAPSAIAAHPVRTLRELFTVLEAVVSVTLADPNSKAVHRLRTTTRRIEAQLELLALLPDLPEHAKLRAKAQKLLKKLRRAAGRVRDLDVQSKLAQSESPRLDQEARHLRSIFKRQRDEEAERLLKTLHQHQAKLTLVLKSLLEALAPAKALTLPLSQLEQLTLIWYSNNIPSTANTSGQLHTIRKVAKLARYMAESATPTAKSPRTPAARLALTFESLQQSGGVWHDWLTLSHIARRELGRSSPLSRSFASNCEESLVSYRRHLKSLPKDILEVAPNCKAFPHRPSPALFTE